MRPCLGVNGGARVDAKHVDGKVELLSVQDRLRGVVPERCSRGSPPRHGSYKAALLSCQPRPPCSSHLSQLKRPSRASRPPSPFLRLAKEAVCFRCIAPDHKVAVCRDPVRCLVCRRTGHRAFQCKRRFSEASGVKTMNLNRVRANRQGGRVPRLTAFVPYTEEFIRRTELRRNAILADVMQPDSLGPAPQQTLANALARRFGGYSHDFFVARYNERDFAVLLPSWVSAETLIRRQVTTHDNIWLRCYPWGPSWYARPHRSSFKAWIQLRNVPFECWTPARVASLIGGFGRFIRADDSSRNMTDLRAFRCRITVVSVNDIPHRLSIILGDEVVNILVHLESFERVAEGGADDPPQPP